MEHDAQWARRAQAELRELLNEWDPVGLFDSVDDDGAAADEYDCIRDPLISHLLGGEDRVEVAEFLREEVTGHFGVEPSLVTTDVVDQIFGWWESVK